MCVYDSFNLLLIAVNYQEIFIDLFHLTSKNPSIYDPIMIFHNANKGLFIFSVLQFGFSDNSSSQSKTQLNI